MYYKYVIPLGAEHNFAKYTVDTVTDFGVPYDYGSVMHYPSKAFSKNGNETIIPLKVSFIYKYLCETSNSYNYETKNILF